MKSIHVITRLAVFLAILSSAFYSAEAQKNDSEVIRLMQNTYNRIEDFRADFLMIETWELAESVDTLRGTMTHMKDDFFKIETANDIISTDGETVWHYDMLEAQFIIDYLDKSKDSFVIRDYLFEFPRRFSTVDFRREEYDGRPGFLIALEPKNPDEETFIFLEVWIDAADYVVKKARSRDFNDNDVEFILENIEINLGLSSKAFTEFKLGENVRTIDLTKGN
ncbi:outer membrane lipoprotein carrier protein LolA [candidate division KSB1 bacterium]